MENPTKQEQVFLKGYASALQDLLKSMTGDNGCAKSYDPIDFSDGKIHSYAFDLKDGGRHHPTSDYEDIYELMRCMVKEIHSYLLIDYVQQFDE